MSDTVSCHMPAAQTNHEGKAPFLDYYSQWNIIPVKQNIMDRPLHFARRDYLYRTLGMVPHWLQGRSVIEFGPGTADNAVYTDHLKPGEYWLVDKNPASIREIKKKLDTGLLNNATCRIIDANFTEFTTDRQFDLVICEGCIPGQIHPAHVLKKMAAFCKPGAMLITTTASEVSCLPELCRQIFLPAILDAAHSFDEQVALASAIFKPHLDFFKHSTRSIQDWVKDSILHDWFLIPGAALLSIPDAITALQENFTFHASSPRFFQDCRWYKSVLPGDPFHERVLSAHQTFLPALMECRLDDAQIARMSTGNASHADFTLLCQRLRELRTEIIARHSYDTLDAFIEQLTTIRNALPEVMSMTKTSIDDFIVGIRRVADGNPLHPFGAFCDWWGRGQQHISLIRSPNDL
ncbi:MAG: class I SAM-dependent methyltransferase [Magnetococcales bacterium]|nr:class I SAM-dependent methyltransferase [Magnetococcales bacterium]